MFADLFEDKYEGKLPIPTKKMIDSKTTLSQIDSIPNSQRKRFSEILDEQNKDIYLNCWCKENHEMVHMWQVYSKEDGVAIETTYENLKKSILSDETVYPTEINYIDYYNDYIDWKSNGMTAFTIKRKEYKSENELRLIIAFPSIVENQAKKTELNSDRHALSEKLYQQTQTIECAVDVKK